MANFLNICLLLFYSKALEAVNDRYYPRYHLAPPYGWMNDPNGFSIFNNEYHLFYQYNPNSSLVPGIAHWGHAKSSDLFNWQHLPIAMYPDKDYDKDGVFSGSALIENGTMYLYYTGNINHAGQTPDHEQHQCLATSTDGETVTKYASNPIVEGAEHQPNFRDPKVWKHEDTYYMVLGNSFNNDSLGRALLYASDDRISWKQVSILHESDGSLGYMFECPDFFELDGKFVLLFSPQGIKPQGDKYRNLYQTGYIIGDFSYETNKFTPKTKFRELDHGHDFYATQTIEDDFGRRIMVAWFDMWEQDYPEREDGFTGFMTIPRELRLTRWGTINQEPIQEINAVRDKLRHVGRAARDTVVPLESKTGEVTIRVKRHHDLQLFIESDNSTVIISYQWKRGVVTLDRGGNDGVRRTSWRPWGELEFRVYVDASSVELFCGKGEVTFSSRFFPDDGPVKVRVGDTPVEQLTVFEMRRTVPEPPSDEKKWSVNLGFSKS